MITIDAERSHDVADETDAPEPADTAALPVDPRAPEDSRRIQALMIGHYAGWYDYRLVDGAGRDRRYHVLLPDGRLRQLLPDEVLPWVLGIADGRSGGEKVAYREGLL